MNTEEKTSRKGGDLFIVDNSISGWTGLRYLREWTELAEKPVGLGFHSFEQLRLSDLNLCH